MNTTEDKYDLNRFLKAQETNYQNALQELKNGRKRTHWIWYILPQIDGLGHSKMNSFYSIKSEDEALAYYNHPVLGSRLIEICNVILSIDKNNPLDVFGYPDELKVKSCMTLFSSVSNNDIFQKILDKFYNGLKDDLTLNSLKSLKNGNV